MTEPDEYSTRAIMELQQLAPTRIKDDETRRFRQKHTLACFMRDCRGGVASRQGMGTSNSVDGQERRFGQPIIRQLDDIS